MSDERGPYERAPITEALIESQPSPLDTELEELERLPPNWNGDEASPITPQVVTEAKSLLRLIADRALARGITWRSPSIAPNPDGGIEFSWDSADRWVTISTLPDQDALECVTEQAGQSPIYRVALRVEAIEAALWAMEA